jgi:hypothetical protein
MLCLKTNFWGQTGEDQVRQGPGDVVVVVGRAYLFSPESQHANGRVCIIGMRYRVEIGEGGGFRGACAESRKSFGLGMNQPLWEF